MRKKVKPKWLTFQGEKKKISLDILIIAAVISVITLLAYKLNGIYPFGEASIARGDMVQQTIPAGMYYVWDILHGKASPFFTWDSAYGLNISGATSLGALLSPLNLFLYFTTRDNIVYFANILMILKMISIACGMYFYLRKYDVKNVVHIVGGILYAFGAASLIHFQIIMVMDIAFLLPLLMIGIDRIFDNKGCKFFIFMLALTMMVNVYTGAITLVFVFLSCGLRNLWEVTERVERKRCALQLGISVAMALALSAVFTIPALRCISNTPRMGGSIQDTYKMAIESQWSDYEWETVKRMLVNIALPLSCVLCFLFCGFRTWGAKLKRYRRHICMMILLVLSVTVAGIELLWHGGSRASWPVRFVYVISFALIDFAVALYYENKEKIEEKKWLINKVALAVVALLVTVCSGWVFVRLYGMYGPSGDEMQLADGFLCVLLEVVFLVCYWCMWKLKWKEVMLVFLCVELTCTSIISFAPNKDNWTVFSAEYLEAANNVAKSMETDIKDFERIKNMDYKVDHIEYSLVLGEEAISNYWHVIPPTLQPKFAALGYTINWTQLLDTGGTIFTDTLFHTQYYFGQNELPEDMYEFCEDVDYDDCESLMLYKNKFSLPFAINTDTATLDVTPEKFATQNMLFQTITGSSTPLIQDVSSMVEGSRFVTQVGNERKLLYFYGSNTSADTIQIMVNGEIVTFPASSSIEHHDYPVDFCNGLVFLGSFQNEQVEILFGGNGAHPANIHLGMLDYNTFVNAVDQVAKQNPTITTLKQRNAGVKLELENVTKSNVFLPISYDEGWTCKVNGKKVAVNSIDGMLSIPVEKGNDSIVLKYVAPGQKTGAIISLCGLVVLVAFWLLTKKEILSTERMEGVAGMLAYIVFVVVFIAFQVILFVIPALHALKVALFTVE